MHWLSWEPLCERIFYVQCISELRVASGPGMKLACRKSALKLPMVYSTERSKAMASVLVLLFVALWFIQQGDLF